MVKSVRKLVSVIPVKSVVFLALTTDDTDCTEEVRVFEGRVLAVGDARPDFDP